MTDLHTFVAEIYAFFCTIFWTVKQKPQTFCFGDVWEREKYIILELPQEDFEEQSVVELEVLKEEVAFKGLEQGYRALWWEVWAVHGLQELVRSRDSTSMGRWPPCLTSIRAAAHIFLKQGLSIAS